MDSLFKSKLINSTETRNIEFKINKYSLTNFNLILKKIFEFEIEWLKYKNRKDNRIFGVKLNYDFSKRIKELEKEINYFIQMINDLTAVIPVRKGSQRVKNKNFRKFFKKNLLIYKIEKLKKKSKE